MYDLHFAADQAVYDEQVKLVLPEWSRDAELAEFKGYFDRVWVKSEFHRWQCFHTPSGYVTTNNPVERFNRLIKRDYNLRTKPRLERSSNC